MYIIKKYYLHVLCIILFVILSICCIYLYNLEDNKDIILEEPILEVTTTETIITSTSKDRITFYVDVKGSVKKPGVYEFQEGDKIIDAINKAGGLSKNANTSNINLAKKLSSEMVVYIFNNKELTTKKNIEIVTSFIVETIEVNNCITTNTTTTTKPTTTEVSSKLVNINTASITELTSIPGIGESKAISIINYRQENKFNTIEDIMNVTGIGEALFAKIKDYSTV